MQVHLHPSDEGAMAISPNNGAFLINMAQPICSFELVLRSCNSDSKIGIFLINIITQEGKSEYMKKLVNCMQCMTYISDLSEIACQIEG
jgi:hypothetical protein